MKKIIVMADTGHIIQLLLFARFFLFGLEIKLDIF